MTLTAPPIVDHRIVDDPPSPAGPAHGRGARLVRGRPQDPAWARPALLVLLVGTALLYLWNLSASGTANDFYAAAVQAGTKSWKAFFFGSLDSSNFITVDKPPASLWIMELSGRLFGFSSWSLLAPQALEGVAAVALTFATVRRWANPAAGLFAGAALALTPAATLIFRFDNPDALLTLLLVTATYATTRAIEHGSTRWLVLAGGAIGFGFITKMGQALLIVPALGLAYLVAAPVSLGKRLWQLAASVGALIAGAGWWILAVALTPAADRPYIGGSGNNTVLGLAFGYNGLDRLFGGSGNGGTGSTTHTTTAVTSGATGAAGGAGGAGGGQSTGFGGSTGLGRLFRGEMGQEISWLLPAALLALVMGFWLTRRAPRTDRTRAALIMWGGGLLTTMAVFSYMKGTIHPYYTVVLAPPIAVVLAITGHQLWLRRSDIAARAGAALLVVVTAGWSFVLLRRADWLPELRYALLLGAVLAVIALLGMPAKRSLAAGALAVALLTTVGGTAAYAVATAGQPHTGSIPSTGPASAASIGGGMSGGASGRLGGTRPTGATATTAHSGSAPSGTKPTGTAPTATGSTGFPGGSTNSSSTSSSSTSSTTTATTDAAGANGASTTGVGGGGTTNSTALTALLEAAGTKWSAAVDGSQSAASLELSSDTAVMAIGGFTGTDNAPTLAQFEAHVAAGDVHYYIVSNGGMGGTSSSSAITTWVEAHFTKTTVGGTTVYNLLSPTS